MGALGVVAPAATAFATSSSTSARLSTDSAISTSVVFFASAMGSLVKPWKNGSTSSMAWMFGAISRQAPCSLVKRGLNVRPSALKKAWDRAMSLMGRLTNIWRSMMALPSLFQFVPSHNFLRPSRACGQTLAIMSSYSPNTSVSTLTRVPPRSSVKV
ncbi:hypothetical protein D9M68_703670 [compost metagenome]